MIEINLLPQELRRVKTEKQLNFASGKFIYIVPLLLVLLVCAHIFFFVSTVTRRMELAGLSKKWLAMEPERKELEQFKKEFAGFSADSRFTLDLVKQRISWADKLNRLSADLAGGVWFDQIQVSGAEFLLAGSVLSLQKQEVALINKFIDSLKDDPLFFKDFASLELGPMQRKTVGGYDIVDFTIKGTLKKK